MALFKGWFKRKNAQAVEDKDKGEQKLNAVDVFVDIDGKKVSAAQLEKFMVAEEAEQEALNAQEAAPVADDQAEAMAMDEEFVASNGKKYNVGQMVEVYKKRNAEAADKQKAAQDAADAKAKADAAVALKTRANAVGLADDASEEDVKKAEEAKAKENAGKTPEELEAEEKTKKENEAKEKEAADAKAKEEADLKIKKENAKKGEDHFIRMNSLRDSAEGAEDHGVETMNTKLNRGKERYGSKSK